MSKGTETKEAEVMKNDAGTVGSAPEEDIDAVVDAVMKKYDRDRLDRSGSFLGFLHICDAFRELA